MHQSGLEERKDGSFMGLTWLCILYMLSKRGNTIRHKEMDWGQNVPSADTHLMVYVSFQVQYISMGPSWDRTVGSQ